MQTEPLHQFSSSPSFSSYSSETLAQIAARVIHELSTDPNSLLYNDDTTLFSDSCHQQNDTTLTTTTPRRNDAVVDDDDFEFTFLSIDPVSSPVSADDIFHNGQITPTYPLFDRTLLNGVVSIPPADVETAPRRRRLPLKTLMADDGNELDGAATGTYCVWTPPCKKSSSTGSSSSKRWKLRDLLPRSHSDGKKESLLFLGPSGGKNGSAGNGGAGAAKDGRRSKRKLLFLPHRRELVGLFGNNGNGL